MADRYVYHFFAGAKDNTGVNVTVDGVATLTGEVIASGNYDRLKRLISEEFNVKLDGMQIRSLSKLGELRD